MDSVEPFLSFDQPPAPCKSSSAADVHLEVASDEELTCHSDCWYVCMVWIKVQRGYQSKEDEVEGVVAVAMRC